MTHASKIVAALLLAFVIPACATTSTAARTGKPCERCSSGYVPADAAHPERRALCISNNRVLNCDKIPAECAECARTQKRDMNQP